MDFSKSFFSNANRISIENCDVIFVSDMFVEDYVGGAELTSDALIRSSPFKVQKMHSKDVDVDLLERGFKKFWIFGNVVSLNVDLIPTIVANLSYSVCSYDYGYCRYRSPEKHAIIENFPCTCHNEMHGKIFSAFLFGAKSLWWMSERQMERFHTIFPFLRERDNTVLSSVFDDETFTTIKILREKYKNFERKGWVVLGSTSWIKGFDDAKNWCEKNDLQYEVVWNKPYFDVLEILARSKGFAYLPKGGDTCPRMVIEAKLLGCALKLNDFVEHAKELWFDTDDLLDTESYLYMSRQRFWSGIKNDMSHNPTISGYTTVKDCIDQKYPFRESISSLLEFCDQVVVVDGGSRDGTWEMMRKWADEEPKLTIYQRKRDWNHPRFAVFDGMQKSLARSLCVGEFCWQQDVDEIVHENDHEKIRNIAKNFPKDVELLCFPVVEYWGKKGKVRLDVNPWKWRMSRNKPYITHGIPANLRRFDENGDLYSLPGSDGCDYVRNDDYSVIPNGTFYTPEIEIFRQKALSGDSEALKYYQNWFNNMILVYPCVHHYSWFDIRRKIQVYKDYWSSHWKSLYNIDQKDVPENNMFFDKSWSDVSDNEMDDLSRLLEDEMGGWIFHRKINFSNPTPSIRCFCPHPKAVK